MAIGRKGSRRIVVDGTTYRWHLRGRPTYSQGLCWSPCTYAVEHADTPGTTLVVTTNQPHASNWVGEPVVPVLPSDVAATITWALRRGWSPTHPGSPVHLDLSDGFTARVVHAKDTPVGLAGGCSGRAGPHRGASFDAADAICRCQQDSRSVSLASSCHTSPLPWKP